VSFKFGIEERGSDGWIGVIRLKVVTSDNYVEYFLYFL